MNQCLPESQGAHGQLNTGPLEPLEVVLVDCKTIIRHSFCYAISVVISPISSLMQSVPIDRVDGMDQAGRQILKVLENVMGKLGLSYRCAGGKG